MIQACRQPGKKLGEVAVSAGFYDPRFGHPFSLQKQHAGIDFYVYGRLGGHFIREYRSIQHE